MLLLEFARIRILDNGSCIVWVFSYRVPEFMEVLPLMRTITGSDFNSHVDRAWMESLLHMIGSDGLAYIPTEGRPRDRIIIIAEGPSRDRKIHMEGADRSRFMWFTVFRS